MNKSSLIVISICAGLMALSGCTSSSEYKRELAAETRAYKSYANNKNECCYKEFDMKCDYYKMVWPTSYYYQYYCASSNYYRGCKVDGCTRSDRAG